MKKFHAVIDACFVAENIDDAMKLLGEYLIQSVSEEDLSNEDLDNYEGFLHPGSKIEINPVED